MGKGSWLIRESRCEYRDTKARVAHTVGEEVLETYEYEGMGHVTSGPEFMDMCAFLERVVPE
jgi:hypothetical protein